MSSSSPPDDDVPTPLPKIPSSKDPSSLPLSLSASVVLTSLPRDGRAALDRASHPKPTKLSVRFKPIGRAKRLRRDVYKIKSNQRFEGVVRFLRDELELKEAEGLWAYVNDAFLPGLDEGVGNLWECFRVDDCLIISYCMAPAFG